MKTIILFCILLVSFSQCLYFTEQVRKKDDLAQRVSQLTHRNVKHSVLIFNYVDFSTFVMTTPRNYSVVVMLTAIDEQECVFCQYVYSEFETLARSFRISQSYSNKLFFASIDVNEVGNKILQKFLIHKIPTLMHFPPKGKPKQQDVLDIERIGFSAETIASWIEDATDIQIPIARQATYAGLLTFVLIIFMIIGLIHLKQNSFSFLFDANLWGIASMIFCFVMLSGHMWNVIHSPPAFGIGERPNKEPKNFFLRVVEKILATQLPKIKIISESFSTQSRIESYIIIVLSAVSSLGMILMMQVELQNKNMSIQSRRIMAIIGIIIFVLCFSLIVSIFSFKTKYSYPYSLLI